MQESKEPKVGITETIEVIDFTDRYLDELKIAKANDGKVSLSEALAAISISKREAYNATLGSWNMPKELADLDQAEKDKLLERLLQTLFKVGEVLVA